MKKNYEQQFTDYLRQFFPIVKIGAIIIASTSLFYYFTLGMNKMLEANFPLWLSAVVGAVMGLIGIQFSDGRMIYTLQFAFKSLIGMFTPEFWQATEGRTKRVLLAFAALLITTIGIGRLFVSSMVSYWTKDEISAQVIKAPEQTRNDLVSMANKKEDNRMAILAQMDSKIEEARTTENDRIVAATTPLWGDWEQLFKSQGKSNRRDYKARSRFLFEKVDEKPQKYKTVIAWRNGLIDIESQIADAEAREKAVLATLTQQQQNLLTGSTDKDDPTLAALSAALVTQTKSYESRLGNMTGFISGAVKFVAIILLIYGALLGIGSVLTGEDVIRVEESEDLSFTNFIQQLLKQKGAATIGGLATYFKVDMHPELAVAGVSETETSSAESLETTGFITPETVTTESEAIAQIKERRRKIQSYQWKIRNKKGRYSTNIGNINRLIAEIEELNRQFGIPSETETPT